MAEQLFAQFDYVDNNAPITIVPYGGTYTYSVSWTRIVQSQYGGVVLWGLYFDGGQELQSYGNGTIYPNAYTFAYTISGVAGNNDGDYNLLLEVSTNGEVPTTFHTTNVYLHISPATLTQPTNTICISGSTTTMGIAAGPRTATFQWFDAATGATVTGAGGSPSFSPTTANSGERVYCKIWNAYGSVSSSNALLTVGIAPTISTQPAGTAATFGGNATFSVTLSGTPTPPLYYQWYKNGTPLPGANLGSIIISPIGLTDLGAYQVVITNLFGSVTSSSASLVGSSPAITIQPTNLYAALGSSATFSVAATGTAPLSYQWYENGEAIQGANLSYIILPLVTNTDAGTFAVVVSNVLGRVDSSIATLNVGIGVSIISQPTDLSVVDGGQGGSFSVSVAGTPPYFYT